MTRLWQISIFTSRKAVVFLSLLMLFCKFWAYFSPNICVLPKINLALGIVFSFKMATKELTGRFQIKCCSLVTLPEHFTAKYLIINADKCSNTHVLFLFVLCWEWKTCITHFASKPVTIINYFLCLFLTFSAWPINLLETMKKDTKQNKSHHAQYSQQDIPILSLSYEPRHAILCLRAFRHDKF